MTFAKTKTILKCTVSEFSEDKVTRHSAALAYYAMFSLGPLLVIAVGVAGLVFGHAAVRNQIQHELQSLFGAKSADIINSMMAARKQGSSLLTTILGLVALLFGASGVFGQLQDSLNAIWEVKPKPGAGIWGYLRDRFLSLSMVFGTGFLLLISMAVSTILHAATGSISQALSLPATLLHVFDLIVSLGVISLLFGLIFKYLPDVKIPFRAVWVGAIGTGLLFGGGKYVLGWYLGRQSTTSYYGTAGSVIIILLWVYYASIILFFGAEFTQVYAHQTGIRLVPSKYAVPVTPRERAEQGMPHKELVPGTGPPRLHPDQPTRHPEPEFTTPGEAARRRPWQLVSLMLVAGLMSGFLINQKWLRRGLRLHAAIRRR